MKIICTYILKCIGRNKENYNNIVNVVCVEYMNRGEIIHDYANM